MICNYNFLYYAILIQPNFMYKLQVATYLITSNGIAQLLSDLDVHTLMAELNCNFTHAWQSTHGYMHIIIRM